MESFEQYWRLSFPLTPPIGYRLVDGYPKHWVRLHALPKSKRYAETDEEYAVICERANTLAGHILGEGEECWVVTSTPDYGKLNVTDNTNWDKTIKLLDLLPAFRWVDPFEEPEDQLEWIAYAKKMIWKAGRFDHALRLVADDQVRFFLVSTSKKTIFAPYDGGFDLIVENAAIVAKLKQQFKDWLSAHPLGY